MNTIDHNHLQVISIKFEKNNFILSGSSKKKEEESKGRSNKSNAISKPQSKPIFKLKKEVTYNKMSCVLSNKAAKGSSKASSTINKPKINKVNAKEYSGDKSKQSTNKKCGSGTEKHNKEIHEQNMGFTQRL